MIVIMIMIMIMIIKEIFEIMYLSSCSREITCLIEFSAAIVFHFSLFSFTTVIASIILNGLKMKGNTTTATANAGTLQLILPALSVNSA